MSLPSRLLVPGVAAALTSLAAPSAARADGFTVSPGLSVSVSFGDKLAFGINADLRLTTFMKPNNTCGRDTQIGLGPFAQVSWLNFSAWRVATGLHGGGETVHNAYAVDGEIGWTYRTDYDAAHPGGHGLHLGLLNAIFPAIELSVRGSLIWNRTGLVSEATIATGGRFPPPLSPLFAACVQEGRPLRSGDDILLAPVLLLERLGAAAPPIDPATRDALASAWLDAARAECASIPAFLALARDLAAVGAPSSLTSRARAAARDEVRHTELAGALAGTFAGADALPVLLAPPPARDTSRGEALLRLAIESWKDGCLGEGAAAARAARSLANAADPGARDALAAIARDEQRHADLAWQVLAHCLAEGGRDVREAVAAEVEAEPEVPATPADHDDSAAWRRYGRLDRAGAEAAWDETWTAARREGERLIAAA